MPDTNDLLSLYLWDLRAQVEAQLRCLTKIHRGYDALPPPGDQKRHEQLRDMQKDMADVLTANASIRGVATEALDALTAMT